MKNNCRPIVLLGTVFGKCNTMQNNVPRIAHRHIQYLAIERLFNYAGAPLRFGVSMFVWLIETDCDVTSLRKCSLSILSICLKWLILIAQHKHGDKQDDI